MIAALLALVGVWLFVIVPWAVWDGRRPYVSTAPARPPDRPDCGPDRDVEVTVRHVVEVQHAHTVRHVHEVRAAAERAPVVPMVVEGTVVRELPR